MLNKKITRLFFLPLIFPDNDNNNDNSAKVNNQEITSSQTSFSDTKKSMPIKK